jgi:hypothetical protein
MRLINPNNGKEFTKRDTVNVNTLTEEEAKKRHYASIKTYAKSLLKTCNSDVELRSAIINLYHSKLREHQVEVTAHPENSVNYLMASLEVFQVCLQHVFTAIQMNEQNSKAALQDTVEEVIDLERQAQMRKDAQTVQHFTTQVETDKDKEPTDNGNKI